MILNFIEKCDLNVMNKIFQILRILISILLLFNKSLMISIFSFSTAKYNAVIYNYILISLKDMILNFVKRYYFEFYEKI